MGEYNFAGQYQQAPAPLGGGMVKEAWFKRYADRDSSRHTVHRASGRVYVLAAHAVENAKLMLASGLEGASGMLLDTSR